MLPWTAAFAQDDGSASLPEPSAPQHAVLENGRVEVFIGTPRVADYQIGDSIPVRVVILVTPDAAYALQHKSDAAPAAAPPSVPAPAQTDPEASAPAPDVAKVEPPKMLPMPLVQVEGLKMGVITGQPSDVESLGAAQVQTYDRPDGKRMVVATFYATTYVTTTQKQIGIAADFMYAIAALPDGQPDWQSATTPEMPVGITTAATENQTQILQGDLAPKDSPKVPAAIWLLWGSPLLALPMVAALILLAYRRVTRKLDLTANEKVWETLDEVALSATDGYQLEHYRRIFNALRAHLDVLGMATSQTISTLVKRKGLDAAAVDEVFNRETLFFDLNEVIGAEQHKKLMDSISILIPRH
jgi:hypothetical protein